MFCDDPQGNFNNLVVFQSEVPALQLAVEECNKFRVPVRFPEIQPSSGRCYPVRPGLSLDSILLNRAEAIRLHQR